MMMTSRQQKHLREILRTRSSLCGTGFLVATVMILFGGAIMGGAALLSRSLYLLVAALFALGFGCALSSVYRLHRDFAEIILSLDLNGDSLADESTSARA